MTLKISFFSACKENMKRYLAVGVCLLFTCLMQILAFVIEIQNRLINFQPVNTRAEMIENLEQVIYPSSDMCIVALVFGVVLALNGFGFLHSKMQSDFYGSLPVKRGKLYQVIGLNSGLIFCIPVVIVAILKMVILGVAGYLTKGFVILIMRGLFYQILSFMASWVTAVLAIVLTGHWIIGILGYGVIAVYAPLVLRYLIPSYAGKFFHTYTQVYGWEEGSAFHYFSPVNLAFGIMGDIETSPYLPGIILWIVIVGIISYVLFQKRPAEAAGRAMTFEKYNPLLRFLLVVPMALYAGLFLSEMSMQGSMAWHLIGILIGVVLFHGMIETIYQFNIRAVLAHKKQLMAALVICLGITAVFYFDLTGYDKWVPDQKSVKSMDVTLDIFEDKQSVFWGEKPDGLSGESAETALALIGDAVIAEEEEDQADHRIISMQTTFHMKNGKVKHRTYQIDEQKSMELLNQLYADEDFKDDYFSLYTADLSKISKIEWDNTIEYETVKLSPQEREEFVQIYLDELDQLSYSEIRNSVPCSEFRVTSSEVFQPYLNAYVKDVEEQYYIYPSFENTIAYLKEHGVDVKSISDYEIREICVTNYTDDYEESGRNVITDPEIIAKYKDQIVYTDLSGIFLDWYTSDYSFELTQQTPNGLRTAYFWVDDDTAEKMMLE